MPQVKVTKMLQVGAELRSSARYALNLDGGVKIIVTVTGGKVGIIGKIVSNLQDRCVVDDDHPKFAHRRMIWNLQVEVIEMMLVRLACAGVDLDSPEFLRGLKATLDTLRDELS